MTQKIQVRAIITGRVQGVFFRARTKQEADRLGLKGWVRNLADGSVEAVFEGDPGTVAQMTDWCTKGPPLSRVDHVDIEPQPNPVNYKIFDILC